MRACGPCSCCCTIFAIPALSKPPGVKCTHLTDKGCGIYETRPPECRTYYCLWADEKAEGLDIPDWARPDRSGIVLNCAGHDLNAPGAAINVFWVEGGAEYWGQKLLKRCKLQMFPLRLVKT